MRLYPFSYFALWYLCIVQYPGYVKAPNNHIYCMYEYQRCQKNARVMSSDMDSLTSGNTPTHFRLNLDRKIGIFRAKIVKRWYLNNVVAKNQIIRIVIIFYAPL